MRASLRDGWGARALCCGAFGILAACSGADPGAATAPSVTATEAVITPPEAAAPLPDSVPDLVKLVPKSATMVAGLPSLRTIKGALDPALVTVLEDGAAELAPRIGLSRELVRQALQSFGGAVVFIDGRPPRASAVALVRLEGDDVIAPLVEAAKLKPAGPDRWSSDEMHVALLAKAKIAIIANEAEAVDATLAMARGGGASFADAPLYRKRPEQAIWVTGDLAAIDDDPEFGPGSAFFTSIDLGSGGLEVEAIQNSESVPRLGTILSPSAQTSLARLPSGALAAAGFSLKRNRGVGPRELINEVFRGKKMSTTPDEVDEGLKRLAKIGIADIDRAIGDDLAGAVYYEGGRIETKDVEGSLKKGGALVATLGIRDRKVVEALMTLLASETNLKVTNGKLRKEKDGLLLELETTPSELRLFFGAPKMVTKLKGAKKTLADDPTFSGVRKGTSPEATALLYGNVSELSKMLPAEAQGYLATSLGPVMMEGQLKANEKGTRYVITASGGKAVVATLGTAASLAISGVRRYLQASKTSEAKNTLGAIGRGAVAAYEREGMNPNAPHALCKSAQQVPGSVPAGKKYQPSDKAGADYETGSPLAGWKCLKFTITNPHYYQYDYRAGGNYKGPKRGLPDPGPNGFEASAEGDLDGDGKTSLFTLTGKVENGMVKLSTQLGVADEFE